MARGKRCVAQSALEICFQLIASSHQFSAAFTSVRRPCTANVTSQPHADEDAESKTIVARFATSSPALALVFSNRSRDGPTTRPVFRPGRVRLRTPHAGPAGILNPTPSTHNRSCGAHRPHRIVRGWRKFLLRLKAIAHQDGRGPPSLST